MYSTETKQFLYLLLILFLFVSQLAVFPTVKAQPLKLLKIYQDAEGNYYFKTLSNDTVYLTPFLRLNRWNGECYSKLNFTKVLSLISGNRYVVFNETENKLYIQIKFLGKLYVEIILYPLNITEYGGLEFEIKVYSSAVFSFIGNSLTFPFPLYNLKAYYQPPLYEKYGFSKPFSNNTFLVNATHVMRLINGTWRTTTYRPENVVGSYAVYHATRSNIHRSKEEAEKYKAGKAFHIYRPKAVDAEGKETWCNLHIDAEKGLLTVTIPQEFLDKAVYPVSVDPTFGYETAGASSINNNNFISFESGSPAEDGTGVSISAYLSGAPSGQSKANIYEYVSSTDVGDQIANGQTEELTITDKGWYTFNFISSPTFSGGTKYYLALWSSNYCNIYYDDGDEYEVGWVSESYSDSWSSSISGEETDPNYYSLYCTYTAGGGAQEYSYTLWEANMSQTTIFNQWQEQFRSWIETVYPSTTMNYQQEISYIYTQTVTATEIVTYRQEHIHVIQESLASTETMKNVGEGLFMFTQVISPTETVSYWQEQQYILTETTAPTATFKRWIEGITVFIETFTEKLNPSATLQHWVETTYTFTTTLNPFGTFQPVKVEVGYVFTQKLTPSETVTYRQERSYVFMQPSTLTTTLNVAKELAQVFITNIETLHFHTSVSVSLPYVAPSISSPTSGLAILALSIALTALALTFKKKENRKESEEEPYI